MDYKVIGNDQKPAVYKNVALTTAPQQQIINESSQIADTLKELNDDKLDESSFSSIDTKTRLASHEVSNIVIVDGLVALNFLPAEVSVITRSKKRLAVSLDGKGRQEIVQIAAGMLNREENAGFGDRIKNLFSNQK